MSTTITSISFCEEDLSLLHTEEAFDIPLERPHERGTIFLISPDHWTDVPLLRSLLTAFGYAIEHIEVSDDPDAGDKHAVYTTFPYWKARGMWETYEEYAAFAEAHAP